MGLFLAPYSKNMRLGQGYNTYLQRPCIDHAVTISGIDVGYGLEYGSKFRVPSSEDGDELRMDDIAGADFHKPSEGGTKIPKTGGHQEHTRASKEWSVTFKTLFAEKFSDIVETFNLSAASAIRTGSLTHGNGLSVNEAKFYDSDINFVVMVKVMSNKIELNQEILTFNKIEALTTDDETFIRNYGDAFVSGFIEGGELQAIINIKLKDKKHLSDVKASLQHAKGADTQSLDLSAMENKISEANISIHWSSGGNCCKAAQWDIAQVMRFMVAFPAEVSSCPQRTWAIVVRYNQLTDYCIKMKSPSWIEYDLATTYTLSLLNNFMQYKQIARRITKVIDNLNMAYKSTAVAQAYETDIESMARASRDVQKEMANIVQCINSVIYDPKKALGFVESEDTLGVLDPNVFAARLPLLASKLPAQPFTRPTPLNVVTFNTTEYRTWEAPTLNDKKLFNFPTPRMEPSQFFLGIQYMDLSHTQHYSLELKVSDLTPTQFRMNILSWGNTIKHCAGGTWFEVFHNDPDFQTGKVQTILPTNTNGFDLHGGLLTNKITFARPYTEQVAVVTWLTSIDVHASRAGFLDVRSAVSSITNLGFNISYGCEKSGSHLKQLGYSWLAYPKDKPGVESGHIMITKGSTGTDVHYVISFKKAFKKTPRVWLAYSGLNSQNTGRENLRIRTWVVESSITKTGFKYLVRHWHSVTLARAELQWIAVE